MTLRHWTAPAALLLLVGCADADGDGLSDAREAHLGTDPELADSDGDGLQDKDELRENTDPTLWDTDGDSYSDYQELHFGSDPLDIDSYIYEGHWPYDPYKDDLVDPGLDGQPAIGDTIGRFYALDQFGETVDFYDYAHHGVPVMVDISALWCPPCRQLSGWLDGGAMAGMQAYQPVREAVESGDMLWVTIIGEDLQGALPEQDDIDWWFERFPNDRVAVLGDTADQDLVGYFNLRFWPSLYLLDEDLALVRGPSTQSWAPPLNTALTMLEPVEAD